MAIIDIRLDIEYRVRLFKNDTPTIQVRIFDLDGTAVDLTSLSTINFTVQREDAVNVIDKVGTIIAGTTGRADFVMSSGDLNLTPDNYKCEISGVGTLGTRTFGSGKVIILDELKI